MRIRHFLLLGVTALLSFPAAAQVSFVFPSDMDPYTKGLAYEEAAEIEAEFFARLNGAAPQLKSTKSFGPVHEVVQVDGGVVFEVSFEDITNATGEGFDDDRNGESRRGHVIAALETLSRNLDGAGQVRPVEVFVFEMAAYQFLVSVSAPLDCSGGEASNPSAWHAVNTGDRVSTEFNYDIGLKVQSGSWPGDCSVFGCATLTPDSDQLYDLESLALRQLVNGIGPIGSGLIRSGPDRDGPWRTDACRAWFEEDQPAVFTAYQAALTDANGDPVYSATGEYLGTDAAPTDPDGKWFVETSVGRLPVTTSRGVGANWHADRTAKVGPLLRGVDTVEPGKELPRDLDPEDRVVLRDILGYTVRGSTAVECTIHCDDFESIGQVGVLNGAFFDPEAPGDGYNFIVTDTETLVVFWYGSDSQGDRLWLISNTLNISELGWGEEVVLDMREGAPATFQAPSQNLPDWGELRISWSDCFNATATLDGVDGTKTQEITRIARLGGIACDPS
jgi:hypothetical protein